MTPNAARRLVADVGGTNTRIALFDAEQNAFRGQGEYRNSDHGGLAEILRDWLQGLGEEPPTQACIAAAAPPGGDLVQMINNNWSFSCADLAREFGWQAVRRLNDFEANAHGLPHLQGDSLVTLHPGDPPPGGKLAVMGPGTGLGGATLQWHRGEPLANAAEPGHAGLSPGNELELELFRLLLEEHRDIYAELLVSGAGLARLYRALARLRGEQALDLAPADVSRRARERADPLCETSLETFCALLGSACGDFLLSTGAWGGLYIAGGIVPQMIDVLRQSSFLQRLRNKGAMSSQLEGVPVHVVVAAHPGLVGAAHAPLSGEPG